MSNYLTMNELKFVTMLVDLLDDLPITDADVAVKAFVYDANGEVLGRVTHVDSGTYGFYPGEE